jgi:hypothetical protein
MKELTKKLTLKFLIVIAIWIIGVQLNDFEASALLEVYGFFMGITFIPILILYLYRYKKKVNVHLLHRTFRFFTWFYIVVLVIHSIILFLGDYPYYLEWWDIGELIESLSVVAAMALLLVFLLKINTSLIPKNDRKDNRLISTIRKNKEVSITVFSIILVLVMTVTILSNAQNRVDVAYDWLLDGMWDEQWDAYIQTIYNNAYKKVFIFGSFIIASGFMLIYSLKRKK